MNELSTGLPSAWIERLFQRFSVMYGKHWLDLWADVPLADVKDAWRQGLSHCSGEQIGKALEYCSSNNKFPPTMPEFLLLCREFYVAPKLVAIEDARLRKVSGATVAPEVEQVIRGLFVAKKRDPKDWARDILRDAAAGTYKLHCGIDMARRALGLTA